MDRAVYNSEDTLWYKDGDDPWTIRVYSRGQKVRPIPSAVADTYGEAFEKLFGYTAPIPVLVRSVRPAAMLP